MTKHGFEEHVFHNRFFKYTGGWRFQRESVNRRMHGNGVFQMGDGISYEGDFRDGEITGQGVKRWNDGTTYSGQFLEGEMHGTGVCKQIVFIQQTLVLKTASSDTPGSEWSAL